METHLQELCRAISHQADLDVIVANSSTRTVHESDGLIRVHRIGTLVNVASAPVCPEMVKWIRSTPADIIHLHSPNPTAVISYFASQHPAPLVVTHHSDIVRQQWLKYLYEPWLKRLMSRAARIISFSPNYLDSSATLSPYRDKCRVIPHGVDDQRFRDVDPNCVAELRQRYGSKIVLSVGRLVYYKGFEYLVRAIAQTDASLLIIGTGPLHETLQTLARDSRCADRIHLRGEVSDLRPYYHAADIFALPSIARSEAFGIVQLEAMACGTPVINTQLDSGVPFVSKHGVSGLTVPPASVEALSQAITVLLRDRDMHRRLSEGARQRVRECFTLSGMAQQTMELYEEVIAETSARQTRTAAAQA
ncbi:MAG TPA: glycosyltransferase [Terriglobales bacterium]|nr:glycosyltransferase [Terriglobales bacterium]